MAPYENTERCWQQLNQAAKAARYLSLVSVDAFTDQRNPDPHIHLDPIPDPEPEAILQPPDWYLPSIEAELSDDLDIRFPAPEVDGYDYRACDQPYHLELWIEKSTMNDVLLPVCREHGLNLVTSIGFQSITSAVNLIRRTEQAGKPCRVFYIADFDPAGDFMPQAVSRQLEYWLQRFDLALDIALLPLALTREQVITHRLPRIPIKDTDRRRSNFEDSYGIGAVELDALEALYPGTLADIVSTAAMEYHDPELEDALQRTESGATERAAFYWQAITDDEQAELQEIVTEARAIYGRYRDRLQTLKSAMDAELEPLQKRLDVLQQRLEYLAEAAEFDLPPRPASDLIAPDEQHWLFDSKRDYFEQLEIYKARRQ